jgi:RNA-directed DNA polymerase
MHFPRPLSPQEARRLLPQEGKSETCEFLGVTPDGGRAQKGDGVVKRKTAAARGPRSLKRLATWCRAQRPYPVAGQPEQLGPKLRGQFAYEAITGNLRTVQALRVAVAQGWRTWLTRRSPRRGMTWERVARALQRSPLPVVRVVRPSAVTERT